MFRTLYLRAIERALSVLKAVWNRIASEPAVTFGVITAAVNTATDQSTKGYVLAVLIALFRFAVSPALGKL